MVFNYDSRINPPAPFLDVQVSDTVDSRQSTVSAMIDTGSDVSFIPMDLADELDLQFLRVGVFDGIGGEGIARPMFRVFLTVLDSEPRKYEVAGWHEDFALLGRDVLNRYHIILDGPNLTLTIVR